MSTLTVAVSPGEMSGLVASTGPWIAKLPVSLVRFATVKLTNPAPNSLGETATPWELILALTSAGTGGRGSFLKSLPPHPATARTPNRAAATSNALPLLLGIRRESSRTEGQPAAL